jgi:hypothetical protein
MKRRSVWVVEGFEHGKWQAWVMYYSRRPALQELRITRAGSAKPEQFRVVRYDASK